MTGNALVPVEEIGKQIDTVIKDCMPLTTQVAPSFNDAFALAKGVGTLKEIFKSNPDIKEMVMAMTDTELGFLTDKSPAQVAYAQSKGKQMVPYTYEELIEPCITGMLQGYRLTNNEFNVIAGKFYGAKNGKYRKIVESKNVTDFKFTTTSPIYETETRQEYGKPKQVQFAKVQCFASWKKDGADFTIGQSTGAEDKLVFKIKVNNMMGDDAIVGKALSKLFSRVLMRINGKSSELTSEVDPDVTEAEVTETPKTTNPTAYDAIKQEDPELFLKAVGEAGFTQEPAVDDIDSRAKIVEAYEFMKQVINLNKAQDV